MSRIMENNNVEVSGQIYGSFQYSHESYGEKFYIGQLRTIRLSGVADYIPILVSERIIDVSVDWNGKSVFITGDFRSYNKNEENGNKLLLSVFVQEITEIENTGDDDNHIELDGFICKETIYRKSSLGREITDLMIAVNRTYGKSDYIPCIAWGRNARFAGNIKVGTHVKLEGRIQSREYTKHISDTETETRTAYEVSVSKLEVVEDEN